MSPKFELPVAARGAFAVLAGVLALVVAAVQGPSSTALFAAITSVALAAAIGAIAHRLVAVAAQRRRQIGGRAPRHRESLDRMAEPTHPDTAGKPRPRAPGAVVPAA